MKKYLIKILTVFFLSSFMIQGTTVNEIVIQSTTNELLPAGMIQANMTLQKGDLFSPEKLSEDIKTLYLTKQFDDIEAKVEPQTSDTVNIILKVKPKKRVSKIMFQGNQLIESSRLKQQLSQEINNVLDGKLLTEDLQSLFDLYHDRGYNDTTINQQVVNVKGTNHVEVVYTIDEKARYKTREIEIIGNTIFSDRQLIKMMKTDVSFWGRIFPVGYFSETELKSDFDTIEQAYWNSGHLDFKIENVERNFNSKRNKIYITIYVLEGTQYHVSDVNITGNKAFLAAELEPLTTLRPNDIFKIDIERRDIFLVTEKYNRSGYLDCHIYADRKIDGDAMSLQVRKNIKL